MDLAGDRPASIVVNAVLAKDVFKFERVLVLRPVLDLSQERWLEILEAPRLLIQLTTYPLNSARLIGHEEVQLPQFCGRVALAVILGHLRWQEIHPVARGIPLTQSGQKLSCRERHRKLALDM